MIIQVTQSHISNGKRVVCDLCPIALALTDAGFAGVNVGARCFYAGAPNARIRYTLPTLAQSFISNFDASYDAHPFAFRLSGAGVPCDSLGNARS
jgi:hypothetical protein